MPHLKLWLLGDFRAELDGEPVAGFATDKARALLAYLAMEPGRPHSREHLAGLLWSDQPGAKALHSLRQTLSTLRKALRDGQAASPFLRVAPDSLQLDPGADAWIDAQVFERALGLALPPERGRAGARRPHLRNLRRALALYRGRLLERFSLRDGGVFEEWLTLRQEALNQRAVAGLAALIAYHERRGEYAQARQAAARLVELAPWDETAHCEVMRMLAMDGQWSAAQAQYRACRRYLSEELQVDPAPETAALFEHIRRCASAGAPFSPRAPAAPRTLPEPATPFIGREREMDDLADLLADPHCRWITLLGPGGVGKSRLALEAAREQVGLFDDGVFHVPLSSATRADQVLPRIAEAVGLALSDRADASAQLGDYLRARRVLLVLDNLEHLLDAAGETARGLSDLLAAAPGAVMLVASRERANLANEWLIPVGGLPCPAPGQAARPDAEFDAVTLFMNSLRRIRPAAQLADADLAAVARICRLVEGMPLAIELAAAAAWSRACGEIAAEIERGLDVLSTTAPDVPRRQSSLRATLEQSWRLLSSAEQEVCRRLSVFAGGFTQAGAAAVAGADAGMLAALTGKSLLRRDATGRYDMHNLVRQFASDMLCADPREEARARERHAAHFAAFLEQRAGGGAGREGAQRAIAVELDNARLAWQWAVASDAPEWIARSVDALYHFHHQRGRFAEGIHLFAPVALRDPPDARWRAAAGMTAARYGALLYHVGSYEPAAGALRRALALAEAAGSASEQVFCLVELARVARKARTAGEVARLAGRALELARALGDERGAASALCQQGMALQTGGDLPGAEAALADSLRAARASADRALEMTALNALADLVCHRGEYAQAAALFEECLAFSRASGDPYSRALHLNNLATVWHLQGQYDRARDAYRQSLEVCRDLGDREGQAIALSNLGEIAFALGDHRAAMAHYRDGLALGRDMRDRWTVMTCLNNLGEAAGASGDAAGALRWLAEALDMARQAGMATMLLKTLVNIATLLARAGRMERAAALYAFAMNHPALEQDARDKAADLAKVFGLSVQGAGADACEWESVIDGVLAELSTLMK